MTVSSDEAKPVVQTIVKCPTIKDYPAPKQQQLLSEYEKLPPDSLLKETTGDYLNLRDQVRACKGKPAQVD